MTVKNVDNLADYKLSTKLINNKGWVPKKNPANYPLFVDKGSHLKKKAD